MSLIPRPSLLFSNGGAEVSSLEDADSTGEDERGQRVITNNVITVALPFSFSNVVANGQRFAPTRELSILADVLADLAEQVAALTPDGSPTDAARSVADRAQAVAAALRAIDEPMTDGMPGPPNR